MREPRNQKLITAKEVGEALHLSKRTVQERGQTWMRAASEHEDANLPSSNRNGLRPVPVAARRHLYDLRDVEEYAENVTREAVGASLISWRAGEPK